MKNKLHILVTAGILSAFSGLSPVYAENTAVLSGTVVDPVTARPHHRPEGSDIPNPGDFDVNRQNIRRIINMLQDAGLNRQQIKRWIHASLNHDSVDIPNPGDIDLNRQNYKRVVNALLDAGLTRQQIKRWINASLDADDGRDRMRDHRPNDRARDRVSDRRRVDRVTDRVRDRRPVDRVRDRVSDRVADRPAVRDIPRNRPLVRPDIRPSRDIARIRPERVERHSR